GAGGGGGGGPIVANTSLVLNRSDNFTLAAISGSGSVKQIGTGSVVLAASSNTYTGSTTINAGKLNVNGSLTVPAAVNGGVLGGSGTVPSATVAAGGGIEGCFNGTGTLTLASLAYAGSGSFTTNG